MVEELSLHHAESDVQNVSISIDYKCGVNTVKAGKGRKMTENTTKATKSNTNNIVKATKSITEN